jgi:tRNA U38,U39,U40 pseudouridine synthase TruA
MKGAENTVRTLKYSSVFLGLDCDMPGRAEEILLPFRGRERVISFYFEGDGFLRGQVRIMTGYLVGVGRGRLDAEDIRMMLETGKCHARGAAKLTGRGLYLAGVDYPPPRSVF